MSKGKVDKTKSNRQHRKKLLRRKTSRAVEIPLEQSAAASGSVAANPATAGAAAEEKRTISTRLRQLVVSGKTDPTALEIVVSRSNQGAGNE